MYQNRARRTELQQDAEHKCRERQYTQLKEEQEEQEVTAELHSCVASFCLSEFVEFLENGFETFLKKYLGIQ